MDEQNKTSKSKSYILDLDNNSEKEQIKKGETPVATEEDAMQLLRI